jgi:hypothetical protein
MSEESGFHNGQRTPVSQRHFDPIKIFTNTPLLGLGCSVLAVDGLIFTTVLLCGLLLGWGSLAQFSSALTLTGLLLAAGGLLSYTGGARSDVNTIADYARSGAGQPHDHLRRIARDRMDRKNGLVVLVSAALVCLLVGLLLDLFF